VISVSTKPSTRQYAGTSPSDGTAATDVMVVFAGAPAATTAASQSAAAACLAPARPMRPAASKLAAVRP
jgi:hypothetical protein